MTSEIFSKLKLFDIDPSKLRCQNFYKNLVDERDAFYNERKHLISKDYKACLLCKDSGKKEKVMQYKDYVLLKCTSCNAIYANISNPENFEDTVYDNALYEENTRREVLDTYAYRKDKFGKERYEYLVEKCDLNLNDRLLDVGCGPGYFLKYLDEVGIEAKGLEVADFLVKICQEQGLNVTSNLLEDELTQQYTVMTMFDVLEHLIDPLNFFQTANAKLKMDGHILAYTPNINSFAFYFQQEKQNLFAPFDHVCFYDMKSLEYLCKNSGFEIVSIDYFGLDMIDYLSMKEYEDDINYNEKLKDIIPYLQGLIDDAKLANHMRIIFKKVKEW